MAVYPQIAFSVDGILVTELQYCGSSLCIIPTSQKEHKRQKGSDSDVRARSQCSRADAAETRP